jgi:acetyltransferase-like isoleucine patch superfamily enzyme
MNILHISNDFSFTKVHANLYRELDAMGVKQTVFNPMRVSQKEFIARNEFPAKNTRFVYAPVVKPIHRYVYHIKREIVYHALINRININDFNLVHATTLLTDGGIAYKLYRKYHLPYVVAVRNTDINGFLDKLPHIWSDARKILLNAERIFFISESLKQKFEKHRAVRAIIPKINEKFVLLPNGIDDFFIDHVSSVSHEGHKVVYVGDFSNNKNVSRLCDAVVQLSQEDGLRDISLDLVGGGKDEGSVVEEKIRLNPNIISYLGRIEDKSKLCEELNSGAVFAMPSIHETFGLVYLEALSQNLPVLYTKGQGIDGLFGPSVGIAVNPLSVESIKDALRELLLHNNRYNNNEIDFTQFKWSIIAKKYRKYYCNDLGCVYKRSSLVSEIKRFVYSGGWLIHRIRGTRVPWSSQVSRKSHVKKCSIGKHVYIGTDCVINHASIGNYTCIASSVKIGGMEHSYWFPSISPVLSSECIFGKQTIIGNDVWIGALCCIRQGVTIGNGAIIGAGSVVTHDVPSYTIVVGSPARVLKPRFADDSYRFLVEESKFWEYEPNKARRIIAKLQASYDQNVK